MDNARPGVGVTQIVYDLMTAETAGCRGIFTGRNAPDARFSGMISQGAVTLAASPAALLRALIAARRDGFRLLHVHSRKSAWVLILARLSGFRIVRTQHFGTLAGGAPKWPRPLTRLRNILTGKTWWIDRWAAVSRTSKRYIQSRWGVPDSRISIVWNGIDAGTFTPCPDGSRSARHQGAGG
ncbi:glycosyltransferase, partial [Leisingera sp. JC1]|uniref:glycosyltransferase n=1 Tax=Leisingera sp. JC1 TaxID=1855282 RepID=UPI0015868C1B